MSCTVLIAAASRDQAPLVSHSFDTPGGVDFILTHVPRNLSPPSPRPVHSWNESSLPRFSNKVIGHVDVSVATTTGTLSYWEAAAGIANEAGVYLAESTCSAIFRAEPVGRSGTALLCYQELSRIALEYCTTARDAVMLMGRLAVEHGFFGNVGSQLSGSGESMGVIDGREAWIFHILPDDTGTSAIWCAQKVPDKHASCVANMFVIRRVDLQDVDGDGKQFLMSTTARDVARRCGLWNPDQDDFFDFSHIFSAGEARHRYYSGVRCVFLFECSSLDEGDVIFDLLLTSLFPLFHFLIFDFAEKTVACSVHVCTIATSQPVVRRSPVKFRISIFCHS